MSSSALSFEEFVGRNAGDLLRTACLITWDDAEAEDLVQECLLRVSRRWRRVGAMDMPLAYSRRVLINLALAGRHRRSRRRPELGGQDRAGSVDAAALADSVDARAEADCMSSASVLS